MHEQPPQPEDMSQETWEFFSYIFEGEVQQVVSSRLHRLFKADVLQVKQKIEEYITRNDGTPVKILNVLSSQEVPQAWLSGCDPESNLFIVIGSEEETK